MADGDERRGRRQCGQERQWGEDGTEEQEVEDADEDEGYKATRIDGDQEGDVEDKGGNERTKRGQ